MAVNMITFQFLAIYQENKMLSKREEYKTNDRHNGRKMGDIFVYKKFMCSF